MLEDVCSITLERYCSSDQRKSSSTVQWSFGSPVGCGSGTTLPLAAAPVEKEEEIDVVLLVLVENDSFIV